MRGRRPARGGRLLPARPPRHLASHPPAGRPGPTHRPGHRARGARRQRRAEPTSAAARSCTPSFEAVPTVANAGHYARLVAETARRRRVIDLGIRLAHSDADPAVLAHLPASWPTAPPPPRWARLGAAHPLRGYRRGTRVPGRGPARLAGRVRGRGRHRHPDPTRPGRHARPGRARHRGRRRRRGRAPAGLARAAVPVRGRGHGRRGPQEQRVHRPDPPRGRVRTRPGRRRPARQSPRPPPCGASPTRPPPTPRPPPARPPPASRRSAQAEAIARAAEAANLVVPPVPRWLVDDATPEALAGLLATYGRIALLSPEGDVFDQMAGRYNQSAGPNLGRLPQGPRRGPAQGRPPRPTPRIRRTAVSDHRPGRPARGPARPGRPARVRRPRACWPGSSTASRPAWSAAARPAPHPSRRRWPTATPWSSKPWPPASLAPAGDDGPAVLTLDQEAGELLLEFERDLEPRLAAGSGDLAHLAGWAAKLAGATCRLAGLLHLASHLRDGWARPDRRRHLRRRRPAGRLPGRARPSGVRPDGRRPPRRRRPLAAGLDQPHRPGPVQPPRRPPGRPRPLPQGHRPRACPAACWRSTAGSAGSTPTLPGPKARPAALPAVPRQPLAPADRTHTTHKNPLAEAGSVGSVGSVARGGSPMSTTRGEPAMKGRTAAVTLSNENGPSRSRPCRDRACASGAQQAAHAPQWPSAAPDGPRQE